MSSRLRAAHRQPPPSYIASGNYPPVVHGASTSPPCERRPADARQYGRPVQFDARTGTYVQSTHYHPDTSFASSDRSAAPSYGHAESPPPHYDDIVKTNVAHGTPV